MLAPPPKTWRSLISQVLRGGVVGHHPHVGHGVELHMGSPIFYGLGNFIFSNSIVKPGAEWRTYPEYRWKSLQSRLSSIGALANISWKDKQLAGCSLMPLSIARNGEPLHATHEDAELLLSRLIDLSDGLETKLRMSTLLDGHHIIIEPVSDP